MTHAPSRPAGYVATVAVGCFAVLLAQVSYSLPGALNGTFQVEFDTTGSQLVWITAAFAIPMVVFELTTGVIGDLFGRKRLLQVGAALTVVGALISALAQTVSFMWVGQIVAGLGAAVLFPTSLAMVAALTPNRDDRARAIALWAGFLSIGAAVSPLLGGAFATYASWRAAYVVVIAAAVVAFFLTFAATDSSAPEGRKLDFPGQITLALGLIAILYAVTQGSESGFGHVHILLGFALGAVLLIAFVVIELKTAVPLVHLNLFANRQYAIAAIATVVGMFAYLATCYSMSIWLGAIQHVSAVKIGVVFVFIQVPAFVLVPVVSRLIRSVQPRWVLSAGFALMAVGGLWEMTFDVHAAVWTSFLVPMVIFGIGFALSLGSVTAVAINTVPLRLAGMASATTNLLRDFGFALGPVLIGALAFGQADRQLLGGVGDAIGAAGLQPPYSDIAAGIAQQGGAMAINSMPVIPGAGPGMDPVPMPAELHQLAMDSLGNAYNNGFLVAGICAVLAAALTLFGLYSRRDSGEIAPAVAVGDAEISGAH